MKQLLSIVIMMMLGNITYGFQEPKTEHIQQIILDDECFMRNNENMSEPIVISLGFNCTVALTLQEYNLRQSAFPFDWMRSSFQGVCDILENDFKDFLNPNYLIPKDGAHVTTYDGFAHFILNTKYTICFYHDFPMWRDNNGKDFIVANYLDSLDAVASTYQRRIERFYKTLNSGRKVYLFRTNSPTNYWTLDTKIQTKNDIANLRNILIKKFPKANFTLVALGVIEEYKHDWNMHMVKNFYLPNDTNKQEWQRIFKQLGLIKD